MYITVWVRIKRLATLGHVRGIPTWILSTTVSREQVTVPNDAIHLYDLPIYVVVSSRRMNSEEASGPAAD